MSNSNFSIATSFPVEMPDICIACGSPSTTFFRTTVQNKHSVKKGLFAQLIMGGLLGALFADDLFDHKPINIKLPICPDHDDQSTLRRIGITIIGNTRRVRITGLSNEFVSSFKGIAEQGWDFAKAEMEDYDSTA